MNAPSFLRVLLSLFLLIPTLSFAEHVDGAFAEHTLTEQRLWLRTGVWVSENGGIQLSLGQTKSYLGQQIYVSGSPSGRVEEADEVVVEFRRAGRDAAWQAVAKTNKWTGTWTPKGPGQYEFRVRARVFGEWITSNVATQKAAKEAIQTAEKKSSKEIASQVTALSGKSQLVSKGVRDFMIGEKPLSQLSKEEVESAIRGYQNAADAAKNAIHKAYQEARIMTLRGEGPSPGSLKEFTENFGK